MSTLSVVHLNSGYFGCAPVGPEQPTAEHSQAERVGEVIWGRLIVSNNERNILNKFISDLCPIFPAFNFPFFPHVVNPTIICPDLHEALRL